MRSSAKRFGVVLAISLAILCWKPLYALAIEAFYDFVQIGTPSLPVSGHSRLFVNNSSHQLGCLNSDGSSCLPTGSGLSVSGFYLTNGTNYYIGSNHQQATLPVFANFSWLTPQGMTTAASVQGGLVVTAPSAAGDNNFCFGDAMGTHTALTVAFTFQNPPVNYASAGLSFFESATGKLASLGIYNISAAGGTPGVQQMFIGHWASSTALSIVTATSPEFPATLRWLKIQVSSGNLIYSYSDDGVNFAPVYSEPVTSAFTTGPDHWCLYADPNNSGGAYSMFETLYSYQEQ